MKKKVIVCAPALTVSGYGHHARTILRALKDREDVVDLYLAPTLWGVCSWLHEDNEERHWMDSLVMKAGEYAQKTNGQPRYDMSIQVAIPSEWKKIAPINIGVTAGIETNKVSREWLVRTRIMDRIIVPSEFAKSGFMNTSVKVQDPKTQQLVKLKCETPIDVIPFPAEIFEKDKNFKLDLDYDFNYLVVSQWGPRKNIEQTVAGFIEEFHDDEVGLVLKVFQRNQSIIDRRYTEEKIKAFIREDLTRKCKIYFLHGYFNDGEMSALYQHPKIKALINNTFGEGFGLPPFEAICYGLPVILPLWGGHKEYTSILVNDKNRKGKKKKKAMVAKIDFDVNSIPETVNWKNIFEPEMMWCYPNYESYKDAIRDVFENYDGHKQNTEKLREYVLQKFSKEKINSAIVVAMGLEND